jgi:hypothetical protein
MTLNNYFRLITVSIFSNSKMNYREDYFCCPRIVCKDGFSVSLQINNANYCESDKGYRELGSDWISAEFGFPSENDEDMFQYCEKWGSPTWTEDGEEIPFSEDGFDITDSVGRIPLDVMQKVVDKHGGIDWDETLSKEYVIKKLEL